MNVKTFVRKVEENFKVIKENFFVYFLGRGESTAKSNADGVTVDGQITSSFEIMARYCRKHQIIPSFRKNFGKC